jgi:peptidoglycan/LPS O-acetylase OafA/YrhL
MVSKYLLPFLTFFGNFAVGRHLWAPVWTLDHLWSIALEEQFYILWPPLLMLLLRVPRRTTWGVLLLLATAVGFTLILDAALGSGRYGLYVYHILGIQVGRGSRRLAVFVQSIGKLECPTR